MSFIGQIIDTIWMQPSLPITTIIVTVVVAIFASALIASLFGSSGSGIGQRPTLANVLFAWFVRCGRLRNLACSLCDRGRQRYPLANTCQIPHWTNLGDIYKFVFGYKTTGLFVEVGAYDGESFSNTSGLADLGWRGHYLEPIPDYAAACAKRHASNPRVSVHTVCAGQRDGESVELSAAGPFSSAVDDEIASVANSKLASVLSAFGWNPDASAVPPKVKTTTLSLNTFFAREAITPGAVDVMVVDVEGFEWPIFQGFDLAKWRPKTVIVELQEKQARYADNERAQADAVAIERYFTAAEYSVLYRDAINTIFIDKRVKCLGGA